MNSIENNDGLEDDNIFSKGDDVNVTKELGDIFARDFSGIVIGNDGGSMVFVADEVGEVWACNTNQVKHSSDEIVHGDA